MSADVLLVGKLIKGPETRTSANGRSYALAQLSCAIGEESHLVGITAFRPELIATLQALDKGDALSVAGRLEVGVWTDREGVTKPSLRVIAEAALTAYAVKRKRQAVQEAAEASEVSTPVRRAPSAPAASGTRPRGNFNGEGIAEMENDIAF